MLRQSTLARPFRSLVRSTHVTSPLVTLVFCSRFSIRCAPSASGASPRWVLVFVGNVLLWGSGSSSNHAGRSLGVHNYHFQSRGNQGSEGLQGLLQLVLPLCESRNRRAQFMYLIMQALELRLQLLAERLNCATKGPLATGISSTMPPDKLCLRTAASWARSRKSLLYSLFYGRVRQPLDFFTSRACLMRCLLIASKIVNRRTCKK